MYTTCLPKAPKVIRKFSVQTWFSIEFYQIDPISLCIANRSSVASVPKKSRRAENPVSFSVLVSRVLDGLAVQR